MQVGSVDEAADAVEMGADLVIAQGIEAGGHNRSTAGSFCLVPAVVDAIAPVPVLAAGGIADGRGVVAAVALGADGAWIGTRFLSVWVNSALIPSENGLHSGMSSSPWEHLALVTVTINGGLSVLI